jgi:outer membrane protein assembly factor BamB
LQVPAALFAGTSDLRSEFPEEAFVKQLLLTVLVFTVGFATLSAENWPQWRGPQLNGVSGESGLPVKWTTQQNVAWKLETPSRTGATPIIWNDHIFLNVALQDDQGDLELWAVDRNKGTVLWKGTMGGGNQRGRKQNMSSPSPVTDGTAVWAMTGTGILKAFDFKGKELWKRDIQADYGRFGLNWGYASSPLLHEDALYVQVLHGMKTDDPSYILRIDKRTGKTLWRVERPTDAIRESPDAYTTPLLVRQGARTEIVITGGDVVTGHDPATGKELWRVRGLNPDNDPAYRIVASPILASGLIIAPTRVKPMLAIRPGGRGDVTDTHVAWSFDRGPDVPTPVSDGRLLYVADGRIYVTNEDGVTSVFAAGPTFELLAENELGDYCLSSPAVSRGQIFIRTTGHLYAIGQRRES